MLEGDFESSLATEGGFYVKTSTPCFQLARLYPVAVFQDPKIRIDCIQARSYPKIQIHEKLIFEHSVYVSEL